LLSTFHKPNPLLPDTRSELAVPLIIEGRIIGVLDMQARQPETFTEKNMPVFEAMAVQLSGAIDSARQWELARLTQAKLEKIVKQYSRESWEAVLGDKNPNQEQGFSYDLVKVRPINGSGPVATAGYDRLTTSLVIHNELVGQLVVAVPANQHLAEDTQHFLNAVSQQIAQKAENLRLFDELQHQVGREQLTRQIADRIRAASDIETALRTATVELTKALGAARTTVDFQILPEPSLEKQPNRNNGRSHEPERPAGATTAMTGGGT
jgi:GAF domain-containing protein